MTQVRKPRLYEAGTLEFTGNGFGILADAVSCYTKLGFGTAELEMEYPVAGRLFTELDYKRIILAEVEPLRDMQPFSIYRINAPMGGTVKVYAHHVCYGLDGYPVRPFTASTATEAMEKLKSKAMEEHPYTFQTDVGRNGSFTLTKPTATWSALGGVEGSILDIFHGEYEFDGYTVRLLTRRGADRGVTLRYGKNLQTLEQDKNCAGCYTGIVPYWVDTATGNTVYAEAVKAEGNFGYTRILPVDFTDKFESKPTEAQLQKQAKTYISDNDIGKPDVSLKVKFVALEQTEELKDLAMLERVNFGDTVTVIFPKMAVDVSARIVETNFDALRGRYKEVSIGKVKQSLADVIVKQQQQVQKIPQGTALQIAMAQATAAILGAKGGAVRQMDTDGDGMPDTIYVADNADPAQATKVWRWNYEGWGVSKTGYDGPFVMAATLESGFSAEFITTGLLAAERIDVDKLSVAIAKVIQLTAESITTGKLSVDRLDVDNLVVQALKATEERADGFKGIVETSTGRLKFYSDDGSVVRQLVDFGVDASSDNFASTWALMRMIGYREGVEYANTYVGPGEIRTVTQADEQHLAGCFRATVNDNTGLVDVYMDTLSPNDNADFAWEYIEALGKTVLVKKSA